MELNTSQPQHSQIISKPSRNPILLIVIGVLVIVFVALGLLIWQKNQEIGHTLTQLSDAENLNKELASTRSGLQTELAKLETGGTASDDTTEITKIATAYYYAEVLVKNPDPNLKVTVSKLELPFARVSVAGSSNGVSCIYKKVGATWIRLYCTQASTPETQDLDKRYGVPESIIRS